MQFGIAEDVSQLPVERNVFRYLPLDRPVLVRLDADAPVGDLVRVVAASALTRTAVVVSSGRDLPPAVEAALRGAAQEVIVEDEATWGARVVAYGAGRVRLIGGSVAAVAEVTGGRPDLAVYGGEVTEAGRLEILPFLREQAVSITAHRFGTPNHLTDALI